MLTVIILNQAAVSMQMRMMDSHAMVSYHEIVQVSHQTNQGYIALLDVTSKSKIALVETSPISPSNVGAPTDSNMK